MENQSDWYLGKIWKNHRPWPALVSYRLSSHVLTIKYVLNTTPDQCGVYHGGGGLSYYRSFPVYHWQAPCLLMYDVIERRIGQ